MKRKICLFSLICAILVISMCGCSLIGGGGTDTTPTSTKLTTPTDLAFDEGSNVLSWVGSSHTTNYKVRITTENSSNEIDVATNNVSLAAYSGVLTLSVKAIGNNSSFTDSDYSESLTITIKRSLSPLQLSYRSTDTGVTIVFNAAANVSKYRFRISTINFTKEYLSSEVIGVQEFNIALESTGTYVLESCLVASSELYSDTLWIATNVVYREPVMATMSSSAVTFDKNNLVNTFVSVTFNDSDDVVLLSNDYAFGSTDYTIDYVGGKIAFTQSFFDNADAGSYAITIQTSLGNLNFVLTLDDNRKPYAITSEINYSQIDGGDVELIVNLCAGSIVSIYVSETELTAQTDYVIEIDNEIAYIVMSPSSFEHITTSGEVEIQINTTISTVYVTVNITVSEVSAGTYSKNAEYFFDVATAEDVTISFVVSNLDTTQLRVASTAFLTESKALNTNFYTQSYKTLGDKREYTYVLNSSYLQTLSIGTHYFMLNSNKVYACIAMEVINSEVVPTSLRMDADENGDIILCWDCEEDTTQYEISAVADNVTYSYETENTEKFVRISDLITNSSVTSATFSVRATAGSKTAASATLTIPTIESKYTSNNYSFLGENPNYVISSSSELENIIAYCYFNRLTNVSFHYTGGDSSTFSTIFKSCNSNVRADTYLGNLRNGITASTTSLGNNCYSIKLTLASNASIFLNPTLSSGQTDEYIINSLFIDNTTPNTRTSSYEFALDSVEKTQSVTTSSQLFFAVSNGARPLPVSGSNAERVYNKARAVLLEICDDSMTDFEKVQSIYEWLITNTTYDKKMANEIYDSSNDDNWKYNCFYMEGVFDDGIAVCDGYSRAIVLMCMLEGIECQRVGGTAGSVSHAWNKVKIDGHWYAMDPTWDNVSDADDSFGSTYVEYMTHAYFLINDPLICSDHSENVQYLRLATGNFDIYTAYEDDNLYRVSTYDELVAIVNSKLVSERYLEFEVSAISASALSTALVTMQDMNLPSDEITYVFKGYNNRALTIVYNYVLGIDFAEDSATFDRKTAEDIVFTYTRNDVTEIEVLFGGVALNSEAYTLTNNTLTIKSAWLKSLSAGSNELRIKTDLGSVTLTITVCDTRPATFANEELRYSTVIAGDIMIDATMYSDAITSIVLRPTSGTDVTVTSADYSIDTTGLTLKGTFLCSSAVAVGSYSIVIVTTYNTEGTSIPLVVTDADIEYPYILLPSRTYDIADGGNLTIEVNNIIVSELNSSTNALFATVEDALVYGSDYTYSSDSEARTITFVLYESFLATLPVGERVEFMVNTSIKTTLFTVDVSDTQSTPSGIRLDFDADGYAILLWDYDGSGDLKVAVGAVEVTVSNNTVRVMQLTTETTFNVTVTSVDNQKYATAAITLPDGAIDDYLVPIEFLSYSFNTFASSIEDMAIILAYGAWSATEVSFYYYLEGTASVDNETIQASINGCSDYAKAYIGEDNYTKFSNGSSLGNIVTLEYTGASQPSTHTAQTATYSVQSNLIAPCYTTDSSRTDEYEFAIDTITDTEEVSTTNQLMFVVQKGLNPTPKSGTVAETVYNAARDILLQINSDSDSDFEKVHHIYDWLVYNTVYDKDLLAKYSYVNTLTGDEKQAAIRTLNSYYGFYLEGVFLDHTAVCDGMSKAFVLMCRIEGIEAIQVSGTSRDVGHAWSKVKINGVWYGIDNTWGDMTVVNATSDGYIEYLSHAYLLVAECELAIDHTEEAPSVFAEGDRNRYYYSASDEDQCFAVADSSELISVMNDNLAPTGLPTPTPKYRAIEVYFDYVSGDDISTEMQNVQSSLNSLLRSNYKWVISGNVAIILYTGTL